MRILKIVAITLMMSAPVVAQEATDDWKVAVEGQIEALRSGDSAEALGFAGKAFRDQFGDTPELFLPAISASGYGPIVTSRSHRFGRTETIDADNVLQVVIFVGEDQAFYEAAYQLRREEGEGWRVQAVILRKQAGLAV